MTPDQVTEDYMPIREAAGRLGIGRDSLYRLIQRGRVPHYDVSGRMFLRRSDVEQFAAARRIVRGGLVEAATV